LKIVDGDYCSDMLFGICSLLICIIYFCVLDLLNKVILMLVVSLYFVMIRYNWCGE